MANDRPPKHPNESENSALARYLAKQRQEKQVQAAKEAPATKSGLRAALASAKPKTPQPVSQKVPPLKEKPSLAGIERPAQAEVAQPASLRHWEEVADSRLSESEERARAAGAPAIPPQAGATSTAQVRARAIEADGLKAAEFGPRAVAWFLDFVIIFALGWPVKKILFSVLGLVFGGAAIDTYGDGIRSLITLVILYFYYGYFYSTKAASPGKLLFGLEVYEADGVTKLSYMKAFFREFAGKIISAIPFFMGYVIVAMRPDRRALHDLLFETRVIKKSEMIV